MLQYWASLDPSRTGKKKALILDTGHGDRLMVDYSAAGDHLQEFRDVWTAGPWPRRKA